MNVNNRLFSGLLAGVIAFAVMPLRADADVLVAANYVDADLGNDAWDGASWATAKKTIQAAVDVTAEGGTVWVTNGVYNLGGATAPDDLQANRVYYTRPMTIRSVNGPDQTFIVGAAGSNGSNDVDSVRGVEMQTNSALLGFTVMGGTTIKTDVYPHFDEDGAGIWMTIDCVVSNCTIAGNKTTASGGGVYLANGGLLTHSRIALNQSKRGGGGVRINYGGVVEDCTVENNVDLGYGGGGGVSIEGYGRLRRSEVRGNQSSSGGGIKASGMVPGEVLINNCLVIDNLSTGGGGGISGDQALVVNCTLVGNEAQDAWRGGGGFGESMMGGSSLYNCIIWNNTAPTHSDFHLMSYGGEWSQSVVSNVCASSGVTSGEHGCITNAPLFVDAAATNYQLQAASPCVNAGNNTYAPTGSDLAGNARINNSIVDIGAYEQTAILPTYVITTTAGANGTMSPLNPSVYQGADRHITIYPDVAYKIDELTVDGTLVPTLGTYTFTNVQSEHTIAATFTLDWNTLSVNDGLGDGSYTNAAIVPVVAVAAPNGMAFSHWSVVPVEYVANLVNTSAASTTFIMPQENVALMANYTGIVEVQNVSAAQRPGTKLVDISYDVISSATNLVSVSLSVSNATTAVSAVTLSGDVGSGVSTGTVKSILWDAGADWDGQVANLSFSVAGSSGTLDSYPDSAVQSVDSRNYTLTVSSKLRGAVGNVSRWGAYEVSRSSGAVESTLPPVVKQYTHSTREEGKSSSYLSRSVGSDFRNAQQGHLMPITVMGPAPGASIGFSGIQVDPKAGTVKARAGSLNRGGPRYWRDSDGDLREYSIYQGYGWGYGGSDGLLRRLFEVTGTSPVTLTLDIRYDARLESKIGSAAGCGSISLVTRVKDLDAYFEQFNEMGVGLMTDIGGDTNSYNWLFGEGQDVADFLLQESYESGIGYDEAAERDVSGGGQYSFTANPGDFILVDDWFGMSASCKNPFVPEGLYSAYADDGIFSSVLRVDGNSGGGIHEHVWFDGESIGAPVPAIGTHSDYCWMSVVTCSVDSVEGYAHAGWTGTGSVPASGSSSTTGAITLSDLNSSIDWDWAFDGYGLTVENGTGSGTYTNGAMLPVAANAGNFYKWTGDAADLLDDSYAASTSLRMPATHVTLTPLYRPAEVYVNAAMPDDSQDGNSWATAKKTIQAAVDLVAMGGTVWVTNGMYDAGEIIFDDDEISRVTISRPITVRSVNGADETMIVGDQTVGGIRGAYLTNGCSLIGFTIKDGDSPSTGGGVLLHDGCVVENCIIQNNSTDAAGGGIGMLGGTVNNCLIIGNQGTTGAAGVYMTGGALKNSTAVSNGTGGGVLGIGDTYNCIVWGNVAPNLLITSGTANHTCSSDGVVDGVDGCISADPQFVDAAKGDFQIQSSSPCIDKGNNAYAPVADGLGGQSRVINGTVDMGAYERFLVELDTDVDGVPDWWEKQYFGGRIDVPALQLSSNGVDTVRAAFIAGLDPKNPASRFAARVIQVPGEKPVINWPTVRGRVYSVYWAPNLSTGFTLREANIPWTRNGFSDEENGLGETGFYKIKVQLED